ncbi:bcl-2-related ovarian killer protein-like [Gigantopelta aegis]|uniref:bcl-2-related ovarian killer protein-like n=1 Tax=Gigantopelta aegis TaxID=1735272 RepID=UPI001B88AA52|nr:bcl-2-related ovarian killer protein-like [Gigantopelta aegis]
MSLSDDVDTIADVAKIICDYYITEKLLLKRKPKRKRKRCYGNCEYSECFRRAGHVLERLYPNVYTDVSRKISVTMTSSTVVKTDLSSVLEILFRDGVTWGKIVSMFAVSSCFAEECIQQGHSEFVDDVIDCVGTFTAVHLREWLTKEGGWGGFEPLLEEKKEFKVHIIVDVLGLLVIFILVLALLLLLR